MKEIVVVGMWILSQDNTNAVLCNDIKVRSDIVRADELLTYIMDGDRILGKYSSESVVIRIVSDIFYGALAMGHKSYTMPDYM